MLKEKNKYQESLQKRYVHVLYLVLTAELRWRHIFKITTVSFEKQVFSGFVGSELKRKGSESALW